MIRHVVMWRVKEDDTSNHCQAIREKLESLPGKIAQISDYEVGINIREGGRAFDVVLISTFNTTEDLESYSRHPAHQEVVEFIRSVTSQACFVDYEI